MSAIIRMAVPQDAASITAIYGPFCTQTAISFEVLAPTVDEMAQRIQKITSRLPWLVMEDVGEIAGYVYASPHRDRAAYQWSVDVAAYVATAHRRQGVGRALYNVLLPMLALQGYYNAYAGVTLPNPASVGLHEAFGFTHVGTYRHVGYKLGMWHDVAWFEVASQPANAEPAPLRPIHEVVDLPGCT